MADLLDQLDENKGSCEKTTPRSSKEWKIVTIEQQRVEFTVRLMVSDPV